jgi:predicted hydrocarbon binding protein
MIYCMSVMSIALTREE